MRSAAFVIACLALACTRPPATCPAAPSTPLATSAIPAEDAQLQKWKAIAALPNKTPEGGVTPALLVEVVEYLGSPDPVRRDSIGYEVLAKWIDAKALDDDKVRALLEQLLAYMAGPIDTNGGVFRRSFSALVLGEIVRRDRKSPFLTPDGRRAILTAARDYAGRELDLRGYTGNTGWAHAAAHTADLLVRLAQLEGFTDADRATVLDAVAQLVARRHGTILAYGEDSRIALAVVAAARGGLTPEAIDAWLAKIAEPLTEKPAASSPASAFDAKLYAAQRNVRNLLYTLHVHGSTTQATTPGEILLFDKVRALIAE